MASQDTIILPQYYKEGFFSKDTLFHPELPVGHYGTAGEPVPYTVRNNDAVTILLLAAFMLVVIFYSKMRESIARQTRRFFYPGSSDTFDLGQTSGEIWFQLFLLLMDAIAVTLLFNMYTTRFIGTTFALPSHYYLIGIFLAETLIYFGGKFLLYSLVNATFFDSKRNGQWIASLLYISMLEAVLIFPIMLVDGYFEVDPQNVEIYFVIVLIGVKILTIYKCYAIFFRQSVFYLQIILYFCALEIVPMALLWGTLNVTANSLKINF